MSGVEAVVLAAGLSSRAKAFKMALPVGDRPVIRRAVEAFLPWCDRVIVVTGYRPDLLAPALEGLGPAVETVVNAGYEAGMFSSVRVGVAQVRAPRFFLTPGDYAFLTPALCGRLLEEPGPAVQPSVEGRAGHPLLLDRACAASILAEPADSNLRAWLSRQAVRYAETGDRDILLDIDTPEDYERARRVAACEGEARTGLQGASHA